MISRTHVFVICSLNGFIPATKPIPLNQQILIWFSGLRGAVAFALGVTFLENPDFSSAIKGVIFGTTVMVIVSTVLLFGSLMPYMLKWLGIVSGGDENHESVPHNDHSDGAEGPPPEEEYVITQEDLDQPILGWLYRGDAKYIRPFFTHCDEEQMKVIEVIRARDSRVKSELSSPNFPPMNAMTPLTTMTPVRTSMRSRRVSNQPVRASTVGGRSSNAIVPAPNPNNTSDENGDKRESVVVAMEDVSLN